MRIRVGTNFKSNDLPELELIAGSGVSLSAVEAGHEVQVTINSQSVSGGGLSNEVATFTKSGLLSVSPGTGRFLMPENGTVLGVVMAVNTAPFGSALICDLNKNGTTTFTTQANRPTIASGSNATTVTAVPDVATFAAGDYLSVDIDQVGSSIPGSDLVIQVVYLPKPPSTLAGIYVPAGWDAHWQTALAGSGTTAAKIAAVGDSVTRGYFASLLDTKGYIGLIRASLQAQYGDGGSGFISPQADSGTPQIVIPAGYASQMKVVRSGFTGTPVVAGPGLAGTIAGNANGDTLTFTVSGTIIDIFYAVVPSVGGTFTYTVDGGSAVPVSCLGSAGIGVTTVTGLAAGAHTVVLTVTSAPAGVSIAGLRARNATGVCVDNYSVQGGITGALIGQSNVGIANGSAFGVPSLWCGGDLNQADLIILSLGLNDDTNNVAADTLLGNLRDGLSNMKEAAAGFAPSVLIVHHHAAPTWSTNKLMPIYAERLAGLANHYGAALLDMTARFQGSWQQAKNINYWSTGAGSSGAPGSNAVHPGDAGHQTLANQVLPLIQGSLPAPPS